MTRGRKPIPPKIHVLRGNPGRRKLPTDRLDPAAALPDCPDHLNDEARKEWANICAELGPMGILTRLDKAILAEYCQGWSLWIEALAMVTKLGLIGKSPSGYPMMNPYLAIANRAQEQMHRALTELGLTPSSRSRIKVDKASAADPVAEFLSHSRSG